MRRLVALIALAGAVAAPRLTHAADAYPIPLSDYPSTAQVDVQQSLSNADYDGAWGYDGMSNGFHTLPSAEMGRVSGWVETATVKAPEHGVQYVVLDSQFASHSNAAAAQADLRQAVVSDPFNGHALKGQTVITSDDPPVELQMHNKRWTARFIGIDRGAVLVEAAVIYRTGHGDGWAAWRYVEQQAVAALKVQS